MYHWRINRIIVLSFVFSLQLISKEVYNCRCFADLPSALHYSTNNVRGLIVSLLLMVSDMKGRNCKINRINLSVVAIQLLLLNRPASYNHTTSGCYCCRTGLPGNNVQPLCCWTGLPANTVKPPYAASLLNRPASYHTNSGCCRRTGLTANTVQPPPAALLLNRPAS